MLGALAIRGVQSRGAGDRVSKVLELLSLDQSSIQTQVSVLGILAVIALVSKTILNVIFTRRIIFFLSRRGAAISARMMSALVNKPLLFVYKRSTHETLYALTTGVNTITVGIDRKSTRLNSSHIPLSRMPSSA